MSRTFLRSKRIKFKFYEILSGLSFISSFNKFLKFYSSIKLI